MINNRIYSLKDFELSTKMDARVRAEEFKKYIAQMKEFGCKSYWVMANTGVGAQMEIDEFVGKTSAFIANDYLGMSQQPETIEAAIAALNKYGTGACAAQVIGGYLDIHHELEQKIAEFTGQEDAILFSFRIVVSFL